MKFADLTPVERRVWRAFPRGEEVDLRRDDAPGSDDLADPHDPVAGGSWGPERTVRAEVLRQLLLGEVTEPAEVAALRLVGARISGELDLQYGTVPHPIRLMGCHFDRTPNLYGARTRQVNLSASYLPGLSAATIRVEGVLRLTDARIPGTVRLGGARISGAFFLDRAHIGGDGERAMELNQAIVGDDVWAPGLVAHGELRMDGARVEGAFNLDEAHLSNPGRIALFGPGLTIGAGLRGKAMHADGMVHLMGARVTAAVFLLDARFTGGGRAPGRERAEPAVALQLSHCQARELLLRGAEPITSGVYLRHAQFGVISAAPEVWPPHVELDGLTYSALEPRLPAERRLELLRRDRHGFVPHAYEQLAASYRRIGDDAAARTVLLAKQRRRRAGLAWYARLWGLAQDATVGYGYRPVRAVAWLVALLVAGSVTYGLREPRAIEPATAPVFNPVVYTVDLLLPIIDFHQENAFNPVGWSQWLSYALIAAGWLLATTIATGLTRAVNRQ
ncbi:MAG TPA: hypothetical protein VFU43_23845 [Streptosporangiaceae bacterium]|nr:hypothetical protein [Streptosporangiaceae bacterium]